MLVPEDSATRAVRAAHRRRHESPHLASAASKCRRMCVCVCEYVRFQDDQRFSYLVRRHMKLTAPRARRLWGRLRYRSHRSAGETPPRRSVVQSADSKSRRRSTGHCVLDLQPSALGTSRGSRESEKRQLENSKHCMAGCRLSENTPAWVASPQSSLPNAAKGWSGSGAGRHPSVEGVV